MRTYFAKICLGVAVVLLVIFSFARQAGNGAEREPEPTNQGPVALEVPDLTPTEYDTDVIEALAKMVWGEARGCSKTEQAATVWCVLNRVDDGYGDILSVLLAPNQFQGYDSSNPVSPEIAALVKDVLIRWEIEKECVGGVGRVLPKDYWSLPSPYEEVN